MLDPKFVRQNLPLIRQNLRWRGLSEKLLQDWLRLDKKRRTLMMEQQKLQQKRNQFQRQHPKAISAKARQRQRQLRQHQQKLQQELKEVGKIWQEKLWQLPNLIAADVPRGKSEADNVVVRSWGEPRQFDFPPRDHLQLGEQLGIIDVRRATKISGPRFGFLLGEAALLELALAQYSFSLALKNGFIPIIPPVLIKKEMEAALGYGEHGGWEEMYILERDDLVLTATTEHALVSRHQNEVFKEKELPRRYVGFSSAFRREAGSYGRDTRGIFRVHQFEQTEFISFTLPEKSDEEHEFLLQLEEKLMQALELPYRVVKMCSADLAAPQRRRYDLEVWLPGQKKYRETHSASNCGDYQARRLNIRVRRSLGLEYVHILNATGFALGRLIIAILENYQQKDGSVVIPPVLRPWLGGRKIISPARYN